MSDWQVGDLAVALSPQDAPRCGFCVECSGYGYGVVLSVSAVYPHPLGPPGLNFVQDAPTETPWCSCGFRKIRSDEHEACEPEFVTLLKRTKHKVQA